MAAPTGVMEWRALSIPALCRPSLMKCRVTSSTACVSLPTNRRVVRNEGMGRPSHATRSKFISTKSRKNSISIRPRCASDISSSHIPLPRTIFGSAAWAWARASTKSSKALTGRTGLRGMGTQPSRLLLRLSQNNPQERQARRLRTENSHTAKALASLALRTSAAPVSLSTGTTCRNPAYNFGSIVRAVFVSCAGRSISARDRIRFWLILSPRFSALTRSTFELLPLIPI